MKAKRTLGRTTAGLAVLLAAGLAAPSAVLPTTPATASDTASGISQLKLSFRGDPATSMVASWRDAATAPAGTLQVLPASQSDFSGCGTAGSSCQQVSAARFVVGSSDSPAYAFYQAEATGLQPGTTYRYRVVDGGAPTRAYTFSTAAGGAARFTAAVAGEVHVGDTVQPGWPAPAWAPTTKRILSTGASFTLSTGDNVNTGANEAEWESLFDANPKFFATTPYLSAVGNHETYGSASTGVPQPPFFAQFPQPTNGPDRSGRTYSFDYNGVHFVVLEANPTTPRAQFQSEIDWLNNDLAAAVGRTRAQVVITHSPPLHSKTSRVTPTYENPEFRELLMPLMDRYGVELVVSGHDKHYVRSYPLNGRPDPGASPAVAPKVVGAGTGTTYLELTTTGQYYSDFLQQSWMAKAVPQTAAFLKLSFAANSIRARTVQPDGSVIDAFTIPTVAPKTAP